MTQKNILKIVAGIALIVTGLLAVFIGFIAALIAADAQWLLASVLGLAAVVGGGFLISSEVKRIIRLVKGALPREVKNRIKK